MSDILVVGAGQLGLMMASAGSRFGISVDRVDHVTGDLLPGTSRQRFPMPDAATLASYGGITAELEHLLGNPLVEQLRELPNWCNGEAMNILPARDTQKDLLDRLGVATSPWARIHTRDDLASAESTIAPSLIVKSIRDGYDGKGQWRVSPEERDAIPDAALGDVIAEQMIPFSREVSLVGARFRDGLTVFYRLVENYHQSGMLRFTVAPADTCTEQQPVAEQMLSTIMEDLDYVGVMAMECFESEGRLLVNELAPRVHNSGHWSQLGANYSQFDLHLFAICDYPVTFPPVVAPCSLMLNLIGCEWNPGWRTLPGVQCWWYGKSWRENRKLGHINITASDSSGVIEACDRLMPTLDAFHQEMLALAVERIRGR